MNVFDDIKGVNIIFITREDKIFAMGSNWYGSCGQGHNNPVILPENIEELSDKKIEYFVNGSEFVIGVDIQGQMYSWGNNNMGELGWLNEENTSLPDFLKPQIISLNEDSVQIISCGSRHSIVLSKKGKLYGWGDNTEGQVGSGLEKTSLKSREYFEPKELKLERERICNVSCFGSQSFAITKEGSLFRWGKNINCTLGSDIKENKILYKPNFSIYRSSIKSINKTDLHSFYDTIGGNILIDGKLDNKNKKSPGKNLPILKLQSKANRIKTFTIYSKSKATLPCSTGNDIFKLQFNCATKTPYIGFSDYILDEYVNLQDKLEIQSNLDITDPI